MNFREWIPVAELLGIIAVVASLVFVGMEIQQSREIARSEWTGILTEEQIALDNLISENSEVWRKGCLGEDLSPPERTTFARQFSSFHHFAFARWIRGNIGINGANPRFVSKEYAKNIHRYAGFRDMWMLWKSSRIEADAPSSDGILGFPDEIDSWLPILRQEEPGMKGDVAMCGVWTP